ncbi:MAG: T9SS type A sorting domain-containing protein [Candidatus Kapabacteria bacterium]|nr:T9SS type A sorting domain-containing protein [Candidatus Kapabacteria bacterium]
MKYLILIFNFIISAPLLLSQGWQDNIQDATNFYSIRKAFLETLDNQKKLSINSFKVDDVEEKFKRWEYFLEPRVYPSGKLPAIGYLYDELNIYNSLKFLLNDSSTYSNWKPLEQSSGFPEYGFSGRANCIAFHPTDQNILYLGTPSGGLWKTTDGGKIWIPKTDYLPSLGVSEICVDPKNPNIIYMATGDKDAANFISNPYSYGLLKSTDGGESWNTTGLQHIFDDQMTIQRLIIHPTKPNILMAAITGTNGNLRGIWRTSDAGVSWTNVSGGGKFDLEFNPGNPDIVYGAGYKYLCRSTDCGINWTLISSSVLPYLNITNAKIAVSPASPHSVFVQFLNPNNGATYGLYKSLDDGVNWINLNKTSISTQAAYDWVLTASPIDSNLIFFGGQYMFVSYDGGVSNQGLACDHPDHHDLVYRPGSNILFNCHDGGVYRSSDDGQNWENLNASLQTFQYYRLGCSPTNTNLILTGAQDDGVMLHNKTTLTHIYSSADGMECIYDYKDSTTYYFSFQYGFLNRAGAGIGFTMPPTAGSANSCAWVTPYLIHPKNPKILFWGAKDIYKTNDRGDSWMNYSNKLTANDGVGGGMLRTMAISESNPDSVLYAASYVVVYKTVDGGKNWLNITSNLPTSAGNFNSSAISCIAVHPYDPNIAWVTMSGYSKSNKVYKTLNGGSSWLNMSTDLPNIPVNTITYEKNNHDALYIGTDVGVFYNDSTLNRWVPFMKGLPNVPVQELEIHYGSRELRAATFGRGLWVSNLNSVKLEINESNYKISEIEIYPNPAKDYINLTIGDNINYKNEPIRIYNIFGELVYQKQILTNDQISTSITIKIDISKFNPSAYFIKIGDQTKTFFIL